MSQSRIVVETSCEHGHYRDHYDDGADYCEGPKDWYDNAYGGITPTGNRRIIDPGNLPAEVIEAAKMAAFEAGQQVAVARASGQRVSLTEANNLKVQAALSAAFRTLGGGDR